VRHATVGVIGHVNHGKTTLVRALTGTDTDRLPEEKRRGMSIVLGFAWLPLGEDGIDVIDVPGHEQFIRTMVSGATGVDATLLVVDAREGVKPQTVEHVAIADLLGVRRGIVAITKAELADPARRTAAAREVRALLRGTHLEFAPVVFTSAATGEGLEILHRHLAELLADPAERMVAGSHFWLPLDRVFTIAGHGTVVTGTLRGRPLCVGDAVCCWARGAVGSVRQLQVHNQLVDVALPGQRVGVNLRHLHAQDLSRGDVLAPPGQLRPSQLVDVALRLPAPANAAELDGRRVRLLIGTTDVAAVVRVLAPGSAGGAALAQLRCAKPLVAVAGERFVLRRESPEATLGGGSVLDPAPARHARADLAAVQRLRLLAGGDASQLLVDRLRRAGPQGIAQAELALQSRMAAAELAAALQGLAIVQEQRVWSIDVARELQARLLDALARWHARQPWRMAAPLSVCREVLPPGTSESLYRHLLDELVREQHIQLHQGTVRLAAHDPVQALDAASRDELLGLAAMLRDGGMTPPDAPPPDDARRRLLELLVDRGDVLLLPGQPTTQRIAFHRDALRDACDRLAAAFPPPDCFTVSQARELLGSTRKFTVPLLQHLHATGQTRRTGDRHMFVRQRAPGGE
jgi:selenocysteine-specific elongation factor